MSGKIEWKTFWTLQATEAWKRTKDQEWPSADSPFHLQIPSRPVFSSPKWYVFFCINSLVGQLFNKRTVVIHSPRDSPYTSSSACPTPQTSTFSTKHPESLCSQLPRPPSVVPPRHSSLSRIASKKFRLEWNFSLPRSFHHAFDRPRGRAVSRARRMCRVARSTSRLGDAEHGERKTGERPHG